MHSPLLPLYMHTVLYVFSCTIQFVLMDSTARRVGAPGRRALHTVTHILLDGKARATPLTASPTNNTAVWLSTACQRRHTTISYRRAIRRRGGVACVVGWRGVCGGGWRWVGCRLCGSVVEHLSCKQKVPSSILRGGKLFSASIIAKREMTALSSW